MNRRKFLKWLGVGSAVVVAAPAAILKEDPPVRGIRSYYGAKGVVDQVRLKQLCGPVHIAEYKDYANFSDSVLKSVLDEHVSNTANELAHRQSLLLTQLINDAGL